MPTRLALQQINKFKQLADPGDWKWSSYRAHAFGENDPVLDLHELYLALGLTPQDRQEAYRQMAAAYLEEKGLSRQPALSSGVIVGSRTFVESLLEEYGKILAYFKNQPVHQCNTDSFSLRRLVPVPGG